MSAEGGKGCGFYPPCNLLDLLLHVRHNLLIFDAEELLRALVVLDQVHVAV